MTKISSLPQHVGLILDGNRRWAQEHGLNSVEGHLRGRQVLKEIGDFLLNKGIPYVSAYVFSVENWKRSKAEVDFLMDLVLRVITEDLEDYHRRNVKIRILGSREGLSGEILQAIQTAETKTAHNISGTLALCFNYGGRLEIVEAAKAAFTELKSAKDLDEAAIQRNLWAPEIPDIDLLIRTSGEQRLSGFMTWRSVYAELYFFEKHWPDVTPSDINEALDWYINRERRYGGDSSTGETSV